MSPFSCMQVKGYTIKDSKSEWDQWSYDPRAFKLGHFLSMKPIFSKNIFTLLQATCIISLSLHAWKRAHHYGVQKGMTNWGVYLWGIQIGQFGDQNLLFSKYISTCRQPLDLSRMQSSRVTQWKTYTQTDRQAQWAIQTGSSLEPVWVSNWACLSVGVYVFHCLTLLLCMRLWSDGCLALGDDAQAVPTVDPWITRINGVHLWTKHL